MKPKKHPAVKLGMGANLDDTIGPSEKRKKVGQMQDDPHISNARSAMRSRHAAETAIRNRKLNVESGIGLREAADLAIENRVMSLAEIAAERRIARTPSPSCEELMARLTAPSPEGLMGRPTAPSPEGLVGRLTAPCPEELMAGKVLLREKAPSVLTDEKKEPGRLQKRAQDDTKKSDQVTSSKARHQRSESQLNEGTHEGVKLKLQSEVDPARIAKQAGKTQCPIKLAKDEEQSVSIQGEMEVTMSGLTECQKTQVTLQCDADKVKLERTLTALRQQKRMVEQDLIAMENDAEERRKLQQAHQKQLDQAQGEFERMKSMSLQDIMQAVKENNGLKNEVVSLREEKNRLKSSLETVLKSLEEEKEKRSCQICLETPKDTICFPCLHLNFCFPCLEKHRQQNNSCPSCRTVITGVLRCDICI